MTELSYYEWSGGASISDIINCCVGIRIRQTQGEYVTLTVSSLINCQT